VITKLRIFISSPGDVSEERALSVQVFERLAREYADSLEIQVVLWEHEPLFGHAHFQEQIERPSQCDLVVCILWSRLGTRLPSNYVMAPGETPPTGTEFEVRDALAAYKRLGKPNLLIYRKTAPPQVNLASVEAEERLRQYRMLEEFCRRAFYDEQGEVLVAHRSYSEAYEFEKLLTEHVRKWLERQVGESVNRRRWTSGSPYRGLQVFEAEHREIYFGRSQAVSELIKRMREAEARAGQRASVARFFLVQGMSGNGKSSLIRAGLLPLLEGRALEGIGLWRHVVVKPSDRSAKNPHLGVLGKLSERLIQALPTLSDSYPDGGQLAERLRDAPGESVSLLDGYLAQAAKQADLNPGQIRVVVFIDQLEELFGSAASAVERAAFVSVLRALSTEGRIWVITTLRSDFTSRLEEHAELISLMRDGLVYLLGPPQPDELADMIREPTRAADLVWDSQDGISLDQAILREATGNPESLPLLEYALDRLYEGRDGRRLTYAAYHESGGLKGGIAATAEAVLNTHDYSKMTFIRLMRSLVSVDEGGTATRRYAPLSEFPDDSAERKLLDALIERRLCATDRRGANSVVSFSHEALILSWPRAMLWLQEEAGLLQLRELATREALLWDQHGNSEAWLARSDKLVAFKALDAANVSITGNVRRFITASVVRAEELSRAGRRRTVHVVSLVISLGLVASVGGPWAYRALVAQHAIERAASRTDLRGVLVTYAAGPGKAALDSISGSHNSPYTAALVEKLMQPDLSLIEAIQDVNQDVLSKTNGAQRPYLSTDMTGPIFLWRQPSSRTVRALLLSVDTFGGQIKLQTPLRDQQTMWELLNKAGVKDIVSAHNAGSLEVRTAIRDLCASLPKRRTSGSASGADYRDVPGQRPARLYPVGIILPGSSLEKNEHPPLDNTLVILYFSGFGLYLSGQNYIMPYAESLPLNKKDMEATGISVAWLQTQLEQCFAAAVMILDTGFPDVFNSI
jgi:hypothetical protein